MGAMISAVAYPPEFAKLDHAINTTGNLKTVFLDRLQPGVANGDGPAFGGGLPLIPAPGSKSHWLEHWVGPDWNAPWAAGATGGGFWPYLTEVDVAMRLRCGLFTSITKLQQDRSKLHQMVWICFTDPPAGWLDPNPTNPPIPKATQIRMFNVAILETAKVVNLIISTPMPLVDANKKRRPATVAPPGTRLDHTWFLDIESSSSTVNPECNWLRPALPVLRDELDVLAEVGLSPDKVNEIRGEAYYVEETPSV